VTSPALEHPSPVTNCHTFSVYLYIRWSDGRTAERVGLKPIELSFENQVKLTSMSNCHN